MRLLSKPARQTVHKISPLKLRAFINKLAKYAKVPRGTVEEVVRFEDGMMAQWSTPAVVNNDGVILYFHGGAYVAGSPQTHRGIVGQLAKVSKTKVLCIDYRMAPEHPYPAALDDAETAYSNLLKQGYKADQVVFAGDSAGGGLTIATLLRLRDKGLPMPAAGVCLSPWLDLEGTGESREELQKTDPFVYLEGLRIFGSIYAGNVNVRNPYISPVHAVSCRGLPPLLIQVSDSEVLLDDTKRFATKATADGVNVEVQTFHKMIHVWQMVPPRLLPESKVAYEKLGRYIQSKLCKAGGG